MLAGNSIDLTCPFQSFFSFFFLKKIPSFAAPTALRSAGPPKASAIPIIVASSYSLGSAAIGNINDVVQMIAHGDEQVKEQLAATRLHLGLHRAAALESLAAAND